MPKFRKKSTNRGQWAKESMIRAVKLALEKNSSVRKISEACNVPRCTLENKIYNIRQGLEVSMSSKLGRLNNIGRKCSQDIEGKA